MAETQAVVTTVAPVDATAFLFVLMVEPGTDDSRVDAGCVLRYVCDSLLLELATITLSITEFPPLRSDRSVLVKSQAASSPFLSHPD